MVGGRCAARVRFAAGSACRVAVGSAVALLLFGFGGCMAPLAQVMTTAPNRLNPLSGYPNPLPTAEELLGADESFDVPVGPPEARLSVSIVEPSKQYERPRGTILVLHGILARGMWMMPPAQLFARSGYRAVLVDLRGHGRSSGDRLTFGKQEARDLSQVIDALERRGLAEGPVGVYGISYGAATSIHLAGLDRRIKAVVAVAPFSTIRDEIPHFSRVMVPGVGWMLTDEDYKRVIDEAGRQADFDPDRDTTVEAIKRTDARVLLIHGTNDWVVPHKHSIRLHEAAPDRSELLSVPWYGHTVIWTDPTGTVALRARDWFDRWMDDGTE
ncbi:MAG: alpha/beta fold hydrolase [Pirellulaceae bacterium]|nr:alpha/beta fold hydrolase [Pirellulaceae bacterium]